MTLLRHLSRSGPHADNFVHIPHKGFFQNQKNPPPPQSVIEGLSYMVEQFGNCSASSDMVLAGIQELGGGETVEEGVGAAWAASAKAYLNALRSRGLGGPRVLRAVKYDSQIKIADDTTGPTHTPNAVLQLDLSEGSPACVNAGDVKESLSLAFTHEQLFEFFKQVDTIQTQIDGISSTKGDSSSP